MSIYDKSIEKLESSDLSELLTEKAIENVRLEFKLIVPTKDEMLKKLSSFANTFGGYLVIGAESESNDGLLKALPGIDPVSGLKQRIVQWCYDGVYPPLQVFVSEPIPSPSDSTKFCYVVFVEESIECPHFLNSRKGVYVRTDEYSQRFEPQLATHEELVHMQNRRAESVNRKTRLLDRAQQRFEQIVKTNYSNSPQASGNIGATFEMFLSPRFPAKPLISQRELLEFVRTKRRRWQGVEFPCPNYIISQHESAVVRNPTGEFSFFEASIWGHVFYAYEIEQTIGKDKTKGIHLYSFMGHLLIFLEYTKLLYDKLGFDGILEARLQFERVRGIPWFNFSGNRAEQGPSSPIDDNPTISLEFTGSELQNNRDGVAEKMSEYIFFALNWDRIAADSSNLKEFIKKGYEYNI